MAQPESIDIMIDPGARGKAYSGRVYLVMTPGDEGERTPREQLNSWFGPPPVVAWDVENVEPGEAVTLSGFDLMHVGQHGDAWRTGEWIAQVVARVSLDSPKPGEGDGDLFSEPITIDMGTAEGEVLGSFTLDRAYEKPTFEPTRWTDLFTIESALLSEFHGRSVEMRASVTLPESWFDDDFRTYPVVYYVTGFSGDESEVLRYMERMPHPELIGDTIVVGLDATNYWGHSVFADSAVTGPWGTALVEELIPAIEAEFRGAQDAEHRYVTGISSGGWGSLWLQIEYPKTFAGVWSHVPDPVDFNAFQTVDIYAEGANIYDYADGSPRPLGRRGEEVMLWARDFIERERVLGPGGQIGSFEAVFSPALADGTPALLFDRDTGVIDPRVAEAWKAYDIRRKLEGEWAEKEGLLAGKLHVYGGEMDNFYLGEAVGMLAESMTAMGADEEIVVIEGLPHTFHWEGDADMWRTIAERRESAEK
ncbi:MAG: alpha/beta hydrolase-fold protein [Planctomycetota bacterium]